MLLEESLSAGRLVLVRYVSFCKFTGTRISAKRRPCHSSAWWSPRSSQTPETEALVPEVTLGQEGVSISGRCFIHAADRVSPADFGVALPPARASAVKGALCSHSGRQFRAGTGGPA